MLVLEAGDAPTTIGASAVPGLDLFVSGTKIDWAFSTAPQKTLYNRTLTYRRGRCLGGSSSTNGEAYFRGSASVYDKWQALGNDGWGWNDIYPLFRKSSSFVQLPHNDDAFTTYDASAYSSDGPLQVSHGGFQTDTSVAFINACDALNIPIVQDLNSGNGVGVTQGKGTIDAAIRRSDSYTRYYVPVQGRSNLKVLTQSPVQSIILEQQDNSSKATGVVYLDESTGQFINVTANKETIVSAGVFQSPQLLMLSVSTLHSVKDLV